MLYPNDLTKFKVNHKLKINLCSKEFDKANKFRKKILNIKEVKKQLKIVSIVTIPAIYILSFPKATYHYNQLHIVTVF